MRPPNRRNGPDAQELIDSLETATYTELGRLDLTGLIFRIGFARDSTGSMAFSHLPDGLTDSQRAALESGALDAQDLAEIGASLRGLAAIIDPQDETPADPALEFRLEVSRAPAMLALVDAVSHLPDPPQSASQELRAAVADVKRIHGELELPAPPPELERAGAEEEHADAG